MLWIYHQWNGQLVCMMKPQSQKHMILAGTLNHISQLHGVEEMQVDQLGTTINASALKDLEGP